MDVADCNYWPSDVEEGTSSSTIVCDDKKEKSSSNTQINDDILSMWEAISFTPKRKRCFLIRAFTGGEKSIQRDAFSIAMTKCLSAVSLKYGVLANIEYMNTKTLCNKGWNPIQFIDWLLASNMHFITAHAHQGLRSHGLLWDMTVYVEQLQRLKFHVGFPSDEQLRCPIFTQDKYQYLQNLGDMANNTLTLKLLPPEEDYDMATIADIERFMDENNESCGWVIKCPFTTNGESVRFAKSLDRILHFLRAASKRYYGEIPYVMIQACMHNRKEYKVIALAGSPAYVASISGSGNKRSTDGTNKAFSNEDGLLEFSQHSMDRIRSKIPHAITEGLFRVDIFQNAKGQLVVNEFESLDANYDGGAKFESLVDSYLQSYWKVTIFERFAECNLWNNIKQGGL